MSETTAKPNRKLLELQMMDAEYQRQDLIATPEAGTTLDEMLNTAYWSHVAKRLKVWDRIEVRPADGAWWAELQVRAVQPLAVRMHVLRVAKYGDAQSTLEVEKIPEGYDIQNRGARGWTVVREADREVLHEKAQTRDQAVLWLRNHLHALGLSRAAA